MNKQINIEEENELTDICMQLKIIYIQFAFTTAVVHKEKATKKKCISL